MLNGAPSGCITEQGNFSAPLLLPISRTGNSLGNFHYILASVYGGAATGSSPESGRGGASLQFSQDASDLVHQECGNPGHDALGDDHRNGFPLGTQLPPDGGHGGDAGGIEQAEREKACSGLGGEQAVQRHLELLRADTQDHAKGAHHRLFRGEAGHQRGDHPPISKAQGRKQRGDQLPQPSQDALGAVGYHVQPEVKALQKPDDYRGQEDHRKGPGEEVLRLFPHQKQHAFGGGEPVIGQLHHKGHRVPLEQGALQNQRHHDAHRHAAKVQKNHHRQLSSGEESGGKQGIDGDFRGAAHKGCEQNGHLPVPVAGKGSRGHDGWQGAAEADEHGHKASAGQADFPQQLVHHKGHPGHVAGVLQNGQEEKQGDDDGQEAQHAAHTGEDAVNDQTVHHRVDAIGGEPLVDQDGQPVHGVFHHIGEERSYHIKGEEKDQPHNGHKQWDGQIPVGEHPVDLNAAAMLPALCRLFHAGGAYGFNEIVAHFRQGGVPVQPGISLHFDDGVLDQLLLILAQLEQVEKLFLSLDELGGGEPAGDLGPLGVVLDDVAHRMDAPVHRAAGAEVQHLRQNPVLGSGKQGIHQLGDALVLGGADGHHGDPQCLTQLFYINAAAVAGELIHHVQGNHRGHLEGKQLQSQIQVPLDVGGIHNVEDGVRLGVQNKIPGDDFLLGIGPDGVNARQVHDLMVGAPDGAAFLVHGDPGKIAHMLIGSGEGVEQGGFAAVLVAG